MVVPENAIDIKAEMLKPHTPKEYEQLLQPRKLASIGETAKVLGTEPLVCVGVGIVTGLGTQGSVSEIDDLVKDEVILRRSGRICR